MLINERRSLPERPGRRRYTEAMITLAPAALERVRGYLSETPDAIGLRFGVKRTGCSGWGYVADLARDVRDGDTVFEQDGVRIHVDADSLALVDGTRIDFLKQGLNEQFVFRNPNVAGECGCGESFTTDADRAA
jgi:iron-sulfur cluster assembly protein